MGLASQAEADEARRLISSSEEAAEIHSELKAALSPLDALEAESCPDELAESTILRLSNAARSSQLQLEQLLAAEQTSKVTTKSWFWRNFSEVAAIAAVVLFVAGVSFPSFRFVRQKYHQSKCQTYLSQIWQGLNNYRSDHDGEMPYVATAAGAPWWKVGDQGKKNQSNTRHIWLLVRNNYVKPVVFICPAKLPKKLIQYDPLQYNDFPDRKHITYSFRIMCDKLKSQSQPGRTVLMSDLNPLFENLHPKNAISFKLKLDEELASINSINHNRRGQNVLFYNGSVKFVKTRRLGAEMDDIFTLQNTHIYQGTEVPSHDTDFFLAP
jgi:hypothetical protein